MQELSIVRDGFKCMTDGVPKIEQRTLTAFSFVLANNFSFDFAATGHDVSKDPRFPSQELGQGTFDFGKQPRIINNAVFDHFSQARAVLTLRECRESFQVT